LQRYIITKTEFDNQTPNPMPDFAVCALPWVSEATPKSMYLTASFNLPLLPPSIQVNGIDEKKNAPLSGE
jgi:hypothetical protein